uniref:Secreted protein n=1 Tax=Physcomitrium patens TaxID=3218 RepID=A0A7I4AH26_PHYPA
MCFHLHFFFFFFFLVPSRRCDMIVASRKNIDLLVSAETNKTTMSGRSFELIELFDVKVLHSAPGMLTVSLAECAAWYLTAAAQTANFRPWLPHFTDRIVIVTGCEMYIYERKWCG